MAPQVIQLLALAGFAIALLLRDRLPFVRRNLVTLTLLLGVASALGSADLLRLHGHRVYAHYWDFYHYFIGTKYFAELGYHGLYEATVAADLEDDGAAAIEHRVRDLRTDRLVPRAALERTAESIKARFSAARWQRFKDDLRPFRAIAPDTWRSGFVLRDHGYNGTPLSTWLLGSLANAFPGSARTFIRIAAPLDLLLVLACFSVVWWCLGAWAAALLLFLFFSNPFNDFAYVGGSYLRYLYFVALALSVVALSRGRAVASGALAAVAVHLAVFPVFFVLAQLAHALLPRATPEARQHCRRFGLAALATFAALAALATFQPSPDGSIWRSFGASLGQHTRKLTPNLVGVGYLVFYGEERNAEATSASWPDGARRNWAEENRTTLDRRRIAHRAAQLACLSGAALLVLHASLVEAPVAGGCAVFALLLNHYYYAFLTILALPFRDRRGVLLLVTGHWIAVHLTSLIPPLATVADRKFFVVNALTALFFAMLCTVIRCASREPIPRSAARKPSEIRAADGR
jgi:hypothetical protein